MRTKTSQAAPQAATESLATTEAAKMATAADFAQAGFNPEGVAGKEGITSEDLRLAYLSLAQKTSKALDSTEDAYLEGLEFGDMYNSETKDIYGKTPVTFIPLFQRKRARLLTEDNKMGDEVDWMDPRVIPPWKPGSVVKTVDELEGVRIIDWIVLLKTEDGTLRPAVISFKGKSYPAGESLCTFASMVKGDVFTFQYKASSLLDSNAKGKFAKFAVLPAGRPTVDEALFAKGIYDSIKDKKIVPEDAPLDAAEAGKQPETSTVRGEAAPF